MIERLTLCIAVAVCLCFTASAQLTSVTKVGIVNVQAAVAGTKEGQKASQELDAKFGPKQREFDGRQSELSRLQDQLNKGGSVLSEDKRNQLAREVDEKKKKLDRDLSDARDDLASEQQRLLQGIGAKMLGVIEKYAKDKGYTLVVDVGSPSTPVLYAAPAVDLTADIISQYDGANPLTTNATASGSTKK